MVETESAKTLRLARYLKEFVGLRSTTILDVSKYESVLWFGEMPQEPECRSPSWNDEFEPGDPWLEVHKQKFPKPPNPPEIILPWIDQQALKQATVEMPLLRRTKLEPDLDAEIGAGEEPPLIERHVDNYPEVTGAYELYRPGWQAWSDEYQRRGRIQKVYAELFHLHTQVQKQGEIVELVLGLGLIDWRNLGIDNATSIRRHAVTARVEMHFDLATGVIRLKGAADGARLQIEDDMLDAMLRPERSHYAVVGEQLKDIDDDIWDRHRMFTALKSWAEALHADSEWSLDLKPAIGTAGKPMVSFAPALILRKRTHVGMVRTYDAIISQLENNPEMVPPGWGGLIDDVDDRIGPELPPVPGSGAVETYPTSEEVYFPLPANREQRRIVEAINQRRGVLVQGPPGTGKSHTIANLMCHLLATGKRVLITAETGRALKVLKNMLPAEIRPLCVSLLGQGGDAFAELNSAVQEITTRFATWRPGAYNERIAEIDRELATKRRSMAKIDTELRSLREEETYPHNLMSGAYQGTASAIAEQVANERNRFGWLQVPREASDDPPVIQKDIVAWLRIRRSYNDDAIGSAQLRVLASGNLPTPEKFGIAVTAEREAKEAVHRLAELQNHSAYHSIVALSISQRTNLTRALRGLNERRRELYRLGYGWLPNALMETLGGRQARWQAIHEQSRRVIGKITQLLDGLGSSSISLPPEKDAKLVRADAMAVINHLQAGGKWKKFGFLTPKVVKERIYLRDQVTVDGQPADTEERLSLICKHIELSFAFTDLNQAWADCGGLPPSSQPRIRLAAVKEQVTSLGDVFGYAQACLELGRNLSALVPAIPAPDWLNGEAEKWLEIIEASATEEQHRLATEQVTACLRDLKGLRDLHDAHPVIASLIHAVEQRNITAYSRAYDEVRQVEKTRDDQELRQRIEALLDLNVSGFADAVAVSLEDAAWDERFVDWEQAWHWAIAENWLVKRSDLPYQQQLWQRRHTTNGQIGELLAETAALHAWTHFFNRLSTKQSAALKSWREAVRAMGKGTGRSAKIERLRREARQYMDQCREAIPVWIMPRYLVAEMVTPAPNRYDLIIVDEASQLGIESLFLFYIAKKLVVVGDDQQISPYGVGIADQAIADLQQHFLDGIPHCL